MKSSIEKYFDRVSEKYSDNFTKKRTGKFIEFETRKTIVEDLSSNFSGSLLDCSCGSGEVSDSAISSNNFSNFTLVDLSSNMITQNWIHIFLMTVFIVVLSSNFDSILIKYQIDHYYPIYRYWHCQ
jgi:ubiquinone/menaquinone biosynthesis C-methylase UbiE